MTNDFRCQGLLLGIMHIQSKHNGKPSLKFFCFKINNARLNKYMSLGYLQSNSASPRSVGLFNFG
jgi:hypothetical protein